MNPWRYETVPTEFPLTSMVRPWTIHWHCPEMGTNYWSSCRVKPNYLFPNADIILMETIFSTSDILSDVLLLSKVRFSEIFKSASNVQLSDWLRSSVWANQTEIGLKCTEIGLKCTESASNVQNWPQMYRIGLKCTYIWGRFNLFSHVIRCA